jgi:hypothetical protein
MAKGLAALISVLGAAGTGYMRGKQMYEQGERQKVLQAREDEEYEHRKGERTEAQKLKADLAAANADQAPEAIASYDISKMDGGDPATQPTVGYAAAGQTFADQAGAQQALYGVNSRAAKAERTAKVLGATGNPAHMEQAARWEALAKQATEEGTDKIIGAIGASAPALEAVKKAGGMLAGTVGQEAADVFNSTGGRWKVRPDTVVQHYIDKDAVGREFVNSRVLDKDGKPVIEDLRTANLMLADYKTRLQVQQNDQSAFQRDKEFTATEKRAGETAAEQRRHNRATEGIQYAEATARRAKEERDSKALRAQTPAGQIELIEEAAGVKLTPQQKLEYLKVGKSGDTSKTAEIRAAAAKEGLSAWLANNPNATPGQVAQYTQGVMQKFADLDHNANVAPQVYAEVKNAFAQTKPGTPEYAETYRDAITQLKMTPAQLQELGYASPAPAPAAKRASAGVAPPAAAPAAKPASTDGRSRWQQIQDADAAADRAKSTARASAERAERITILKRDIQAIERLSNQSDAVQANLTRKRNELERLQAAGK